MAKADKEFIKKLQSLTFGFGAKKPAVKKVKVTCPECHKKHDGILVGPIAAPPALAHALTGALSKAGIVPPVPPPPKKSNDEQSHTE